MSTAAVITRRVVRHPQARRRPVASARVQPKPGRLRPVSRGADPLVRARRGVIDARPSLCAEVATPTSLATSPRLVPQRAASTSGDGVRPLAVGMQPVGARGADPIRLTRLGRLVVLTMMLATTFAVVALVAGPALSTDEAHHAASRTVVVAAGQTLWEIAQRIAPGEDPRVVIDDIVELNSLSDAGSVRVGQQIEVPTY